MSMVTLWWIAHIRYLLWEPQQNITNPKCTKVIRPGQAPHTTMRTGTDKVIPGHSYVYTDNTAQVNMIHIEAIPDPDIGIIATTTEVAHDAPVPHTGVIAINPAVIHHIDHTTDHPCTEAHHSTPEMKAAHIHIYPTNPHNEIYIGHTHTSVDHKANHIKRRTPEWKQKIHTHITIALMTIPVT